MFHVGMLGCPSCNIGGVASLASVAAAPALVWTKTLLWQSTGGFFGLFSAAVGLEIQVCYLSAASLPVPSPEPPELAADVSVDVCSPYPSSGPFIPVLCVPLCAGPSPAPWAELVALCGAWPALGWLFQDGERCFGRCLSRGCLCSPSVTQLCLELHPVRTGPACSLDALLGAKPVLKRRQYTHQNNCQAMIMAVLEGNLENEEFKLYILIILGVLTCFPGSPCKWCFHLCALTQGPGGGFPCWEKIAAFCELAARKNRWERKKYNVWEDDSFLVGIVVIMKRNWRQCITEWMGWEGTGRVNVLLAGGWRGQACGSEHLHWMCLFMH